MLLMLLMFACIFLKLILVQKESYISRVITRNCKNIANNTLKNISQLLKI